MKKEITGPDTISREQVSMIELHSFRNIINVLISNIRLIEIALERENRFPTSTKLLHSFMNALSGSEEALKFIDSLPQKSGKSTLRKILLKEFEEVKNDHPAADPDIWKQSEEIFREVFDILEGRIIELRSRQYPACWVKLSPAEMEQSFKKFLQTTATNSRGKFRIVFPPSEKGAKDYLVRITIEGGEDGMIQMPDALHDCIRDIAANARKYSLPGTEINLSIRQTPEALTVKVSDQGRGIPENEIEKVVLFGVRGSNTSPQETKGGGFGLTKAWYVTHHYAGRMWIDSTVNVGTTITLQIPIRPS